MGAPVVSEAAVGDAMARIIDAWRHGRLPDLAAEFHERIVLVLPGFADRVIGREAAIGTFAGLTVTELETADVQVDVIGPVGVVSYVFVMTYEQGGRPHPARGRDLWVFEEDAGRWRAVWRTLVDLSENDDAWAGA